MLHICSEFLHLGNYSETDMIIRPRFQEGLNYPEMLRVQTGWKFYLPVCIINISTTKIGSIDLIDTEKFNAKNLVEVVETVQPGHKESVRILQHLADRDLCINQLEELTMLDLLDLFFEFDEE